MCQELAQFLHVPRAIFALFNPERTAAQVIAEYQPPDRASALGIVIPIADNPAMMHLVDQQTPLIIADIRSESRLASVHQILVDQQIGSLLLLPVVIRGSALGTLALGSHEPREFRSSEVKLLEHATRQIGQALERLQLYQQARQRSQRMATLAEVSASLNRLASEKEIARLIGQGTLALSGADRAAVYMVDPDRPVTCLWSHGLSAHYSSEVARKIAQLPGQQVLSGGTEPILIPDVAAEVEYPVLQALAASEGYRAYAVWPFVYEGRPMAAIACYYDQPHIWSDEEQEVMASFARQGAVALQNARLYGRLQAANRELQAALQAREEMIQNVSHELRTPIALIRGYAELMVTEKGLGPLTTEQEHALDTIVHQADRLRTLVDRLLLLQTIKERVLELAPVDINALLRTTVQSWLPRAQQAGIELVWSPCPERPAVMGDSFLLAEVIDNLLDNAIKFSPDGGTVGLSTHHKGNEVIVAISDQGIGLPAAKKKRIFERFYQVDGSMSRCFGGMGIGLALCAAIVKRHQGRIWAESPGKGKGTTFYVALPAHPATGLDPNFSRSVSENQRSGAGLEPFPGLADQK